MGAYVHSLREIIIHTQHLLRVVLSTSYMINRSHVFVKRARLTKSGDKWHGILRGEDIVKEGKRMHFTKLTDTVCLYRAWWRLKKCVSKIKSTGMAEDEQKSKGVPRDHLISWVQSILIRASGPVPTLQRLSCLLRIRFLHIFSVTQDDAGQWARVLSLPMRSCRCDEPWSTLPRPNSSALRATAFSNRHV
jgi:hypothetical protein